MPVRHQADDTRRVRVRDETRHRVNDLWRFPHGRSRPPSLILFVPLRNDINLLQPQSDLIILFSCLVGLPYFLDFQLFSTRLVLFHVACFFASPGNDAFPSWPLYILDNPIEPARVGGSVSLQHELIARRPLSIAVPYKTRQGASKSFRDAKTVRQILHAPVVPPRSPCAAPASRHP